LWEFYNESMFNDYASYHSNMKNIIDLELKDKKEMKQIISYSGKKEKIFLNLLFKSKYKLAYLINKKIIKSYFRA